MPPSLILASASTTRARLLQAAGIMVTCHPARIDEAAVRDAMLQVAAPARDIADTLADLKARKLADRHPEAVVIGCDQVLELDGTLFSKAESVDAAKAQLRALRGRTHSLFSAVVLYHNANPVWRHVGEVRLTMRQFSDAYLDDYLSRGWAEIRHCVGCYQMEAEGARLFSRIDGDYFSILGLPLLPLAGYLAERGFIAS